MILNGFISKNVQPIFASISSSGILHQGHPMTASPVLIMRLAVFTVSPKRANCGFWEPTTPLITSDQRLLDPKTYWICMDLRTWLLDVGFYMNETTTILGNPRF